MSVNTPNIEPIAVGIPTIDVDMRPMMTRPKNIAIVALGLSAPAFIQNMMQSQYMKNPYDEVWSLNRGMLPFRHDKLFVMDDLRWLEECKDKVYADTLKKHDRPIITSTPYPEWPTSVPYPLHEVLEHFHDDILCSNTVSYALAYAMFIGVEQVHLYGCDFIYPHGSEAEKGGMAVAFLLGMCKAAGIKYAMPPTSTMLYSNTAKIVNGELQRPHYGYHRKEELEKFRASKAKKESK